MIAHPGIDQRFSHLRATGVTGAQKQNFALIHVRHLALGLWRYHAQRVTDRVVDRGLLHVVGNHNGFGDFMIDSFQMID
jgi:hypothetical protein